MITCFLAYFNDIAVGAVCCRVDHSQNQKRLYIMTLGCLAPYRRLGIGELLFVHVKHGTHPTSGLSNIRSSYSTGTKMLNHVLNICEKDGTFDNIYLWVSNRCVSGTIFGVWGPKWWTFASKQKLYCYVCARLITDPVSLLSSPQSRADQQWVGHRFLPEVWLWDHWNKKELLQEDRAGRRPRVAEEPSQPVCTAQRRASEGRVGPQRTRRAQMWLPLQKRNCDKGPQGQHVQHFVQRTLKDKSKFTVQKKMLHLFCKKGPLWLFCICYFTPFFI